MSQKKQFDDNFRSAPEDLIVGVDEVGRGSLAGPLFVCALILDPHFDDEDIDDSKKLSKKKREELNDIILKHVIEYQIVEISALRIDEINIYNATLEGMNLAINKLKAKYKQVLIDYMPIKGAMSFAHGDAKSLSIASASIVAKVARDKYMYELDKKYPMYHFKDNVGYGTKAHFEALLNFGPIKGLHRFSYKPIQEILNPKVSLF